MELAKNGTEKSNNFAGSVYDTMSHFGGSLLRFDQNERFDQTPFTTSNQYDDDHDYLMRWEENSQHSNLHQVISSRCTTTNSNMQSNYASSNNELLFGWPTATDANANATVSCIQDHERQGSCLSKRPSTGESMQAAKKQCKFITKTLKSKTKDPQSVAAKNRRERISERMKILQDLVPNGSKVDLVTMLEKAISYVKFLQLQVKVLATDEFWPAQGGKAPDISQVKEAIDAILASQRDRNSSSTS